MNPDDFLDRALDAAARKEREPKTPNADEFLSRLRERIERGDMGQGDGVATEAPPAPVSIWRPNPWLLRAALMPLALGAWLVWSALSGPDPDPDPGETQELAVQDLAVVEELDLLFGLEDVSPEQLGELDPELVELVESLELLGDVSPELLENS